MYSNLPNSSFMINSSNELNYTDINGSDNTNQESRDSQPLNCDKTINDSIEDMALDDLDVSLIENDLDVSLIEDDKSIEYSLDNQNIEEILSNNLDLSLLDDNKPTEKLLDEQNIDEIKEISSSSLNLSLLDDNIPVEPVENLLDDQIIDKIEDILSSSLDLSLLDSDSSIEDSLCNSTIDDDEEIVSADLYTSSSSNSPVENLLDDQTMNDVEEIISADLYTSSSSNSSIENLLDDQTINNVAEIISADLDASLIDYIDTATNHIDSENIIEELDALGLSTISSINMEELDVLESSTTSPINTEELDVLESSTTSPIINVEDLDAPESSTTSPIINVEYLDAPESSTTSPIINVEYLDAPESSTTSLINTEELNAPESSTTSLINTEELNAPESSTTSLINTEELNAPELSTTSSINQIKLVEINAVTESKITQETTDKKAHLPNEKDSTSQSCVEHIMPEELILVQDVYIKEDIYSSKLTMSIYENSIKKIDIDKEKSFRKALLEEFKSEIKDNNFNQSDIYVSRTYSKIRNYIANKLSQHINDILYEEDINIIPGISTSDIHSKCLSNRVFFDKLGGYCNELAKRIEETNSEEFSSIIQDYISFISESSLKNVIYKITPDKKNKLLPLLKIIIIETIINLPQKIKSVIEKLDPSDVSMGMFVQIHGIYIPRLFLRKTINNYKSYNLMTENKSIDTDDKSMKMKLEESLHNTTTLHEGMILSLNKSTVTSMISHLLKDISSKESDFEQSPLSNTEYALHEKSRTVTAVYTRCTIVPSSRINPTAYEYAIRKINIDSSGEIKRTIVKQINKINDTDIKMQFTNISTTYSNIRTYIAEKISLYINGIVKNEEIMITPGMSISDIKDKYLSNNVFFDELYKCCQEVNKNIHKNEDEDFLNLIQKSIITKSGNHLPTNIEKIDANRRKKLSMVLKKLIERTVSGLPLLLKDTMEKITQTNLSRSLFVHIHGANITKSFLRNQLRSYIDYRTRMENNSPGTTNKFIEEKLKESFRKSVIMHEGKTVSPNEHEVELMAHYLMLDMNYFYRHNLETLIENKNKTQLAFPGSKYPCIENKEATNQDDITEKSCEPISVAEVDNPTFKKSGTKRAYKNKAQSAPHSFKKPCIENKEVTNQDDITEKYCDPISITEVDNPTFKKSGTKRTYGNKSRSTFYRLKKLCIENKEATNKDNITEKSCEPISVEEVDNPTFKKSGTKRTYENKAQSAPHSSKKPCIENKEATNQSDHTEKSCEPISVIELDNPMIKKIRISKTYENKTQSTSHSSKKVWVINKETVEKNNITEKSCTTPSAFEPDCESTKISEKNTSSNEQDASLQNFVMPEELELAEKSYSFNDILSPVMNKSVYQYLIEEKISIDEENLLSSAVIKEFRNTIKKERITKSKIDLNVISINIRKYISNEVSEYINEIINCTDIILTPGMSILDVKNKCMSNEIFFDRLSKFCQKIAQDISKINDKDFWPIIRTSITFHTNNYFKTDMEQISKSGRNRISKLLKSLIIDSIYNLPRNINIAMDKIHKNEIIKATFIPVHSVCFNRSFMRKIAKIYSDSDSTSEKEIDNSLIKTKLEEALQTSVVIHNGMVLSPNKCTVESISNYLLADMSNLNRKIPTKEEDPQLIIQKHRMPENSLIIPFQQHTRMDIYSSELSISVYENAIKKLDIDKEKLLEGAILKEFKTRMENMKFDTSTINISSTYSKICEYIICKVSPYINYIMSIENIDITPGMSILEAYGEYISNQVFFDRLRKCCKKIERDINETTDEEILSLMPNIIHFYKEPHNYFYIANTQHNREKRPIFACVLRNLVVANIRKLPQSIKSIMEEFSEDEIFKNLFSFIYGIHVTKLLMKNIANIASTHNLMIKNKYLKIDEGLINSKFIEAIDKPTVLHEEKVLLPNEYTAKLMANLLVSDTIRGDNLVCSSVCSGIFIEKDTPKTNDNQSTSRESQHSIDFPALRKSIYEIAIERIIIDEDKVLTNILLEEFNNAGSSNINIPSIDISVIHSNIKKYILDKVRPFIDSNISIADISIHPGMSILFMKNRCLSNSIFLSKLYEHCKKITSDISEIPHEEFQHIIDLNSTLEIGNYDKRNKISQTLKCLTIDTILDLPEAIISAISKFEPTDILDSLFTQLHGARVNKSAIRNILEVYNDVDDGETRNDECHPYEKPKLEDLVKKCIVLSKNATLSPSNSTVKVIIENLSPYIHKPV